MMKGYAVRNAENDSFSVYHAIYADANIYACFDWNERLSVTAGQKGRFIFDGGRMIGGFSLTDNQLSCPFLVPPFCDRVRFWELTLEYAAEKCGGEVQMTEIPQKDAEILAQTFGAVFQWSQRRMQRPTAPADVQLSDGYYFETPVADDIPDIVQTVYDAHASGYTSAVREPDRNEIEEAIKRRFDLFSQTQSIHMSTLVRHTETNEVAGICMAGIYPDSSNQFSTIHQVSVRPQHRRKGIAEAMMLRSIDLAHARSPVITLGVMVGNPAECLYRKVGFAPGPCYSQMVYTRGESLA